MTYTIIFPIYNEKKNIIHLINALHNSFLMNDNKCISILLVNDGSKDNSEDLIKKNIKGKKKILLFSHKKNMGYGASLKTGINYSKDKSKYVIYMDSDLTNPINDVKKISYYMSKDVDYIQANRYGHKLEHIEIHRRLISYIGNIICKFFVNIKINDYTNGFRAVKVNLYRGIKLKENDFSIILEEKYKLKKKIKTISEFKTRLGTRKKILKKSSFDYSIKLISKYLFYAVLSIFKMSKNLQKV